MFPKNLKEFIVNHISKVNNELELENQKLKNELQKIKRSLPGFFCECGEHAGDDGYGGHYCVCNKWICDKCVEEAYTCDCCEYPAVICKHCLPSYITDRLCVCGRKLIICSYSLDSDYIENRKGKCENCGSFPCVHIEWFNCECGRKCSDCPDTGCNKCGRINPRGNFKRNEFFPE